MLDMKDNIKKNMSAINERGLVGKVVETTIKFKSFIIN